MRIDGVREEDGLYSARDLGKVLGFGARGGNLTRNFKHAAKWKGNFTAGVDYLTRPDKSVWLKLHAVFRVLRLVRNTDKNPDRVKKASALLGFPVTKQKPAEGRRKNTDKARDSRLLYVYQGRSLRDGPKTGQWFIIDDEDLRAVQLQSTSTLRHMSRSSTTAFTWAVRELVLENRRKARRKVYDHVEAALKRRNRRGEPVAVRVRV